MSIRPRPCDRPPVCYGYARYSSELQNGGLSIEIQCKAIRDYHANDRRSPRHLGIDLADIVTDPAVSATRKRFLERPGGRILDAILGNGDHVVFAKINRVIRSAADFYDFYRRWYDRGVVIHVIDEQFVSDDPEAGPQKKFMLGLMALAAEYESGVIGQRRKDTKAYLRHQGFRTDSRPALGWMFQPPAQLGGKVRVVQDPDVRAQMLWICQEIATGHDHWTIARYLNKSGTKRKVLRLLPDKQWKYERSIWDYNDVRNHNMAWLRICKIEGLDPLTGESVPEETTG